MNDVDKKTVRSVVRSGGRWRWSLIALAVGFVFYIGHDVFQGKMLGMLGGTTVDPRSSLGARTRSLSMESQLITLTDTVAALKHRAKKRLEAPEVTLAIPQAYINVLGTEKAGWFETNITNIALQVSSENFKPYRTEFQRLRKEALDTLNIELIPRKPPNPDPQDMVFPNADAKTRYEAELLRRGFTRINVGIGTGAKLNPEKRIRSLLHFPFRNAGDSIKKFEVLEGCVTSQGPYPNSVRYDHSPEARAPEPGARKTSCIRTVHQPVSFAIVQYDHTDKITTTVTCSFHSNGANSCHAKFYWREVWSVGLVVSADYVNHVPEFISKTKSLFESFELAARPQQ